jgi:hypothetical protein
MKTFSFYHRETGLLNGRTFSTDDDGMIDANIKLYPSHAAIEGAHDHRNKRVNVTTGAVEDYQPPVPSADHEWNTETKLWELKDEVKVKQQAQQKAREQIAWLEASQHRAVREAMLDPIGGIRRLKAIDDQIAVLRSQLI